MFETPPLGITRYEIPPRTRSPHFLKAKGLSQRVSFSYLNAWGAKDEIVKEAAAYIDRVKDKVLLFRDKDTDKLKVIPYKTRFSYEYYDQICEKLETIESKTAVFLTLTISPRRFISLSHAYKNLTKSWAKLIDLLNIRRVRQGKKKLQYVKVIEFQKNGSPHVHALFFDIAWLMAAGELRHFWNQIYGEGIFVKLEYITNNNQKVVSYIKKYIEKRLEINQEEFDDLGSLDHLALSWALNLRAFSNSQAIFNRCAPEQFRQNLEYLGSFPGAWVNRLDGVSYDEAKGYLDLIRNPSTIFDDIWEYIIFMGLPEGRHDIRPEYLK